MKTFFDGHLIAFFTNIVVCVDKLLIALLNKPKRTNTENYLREFKTAQISLNQRCAKLNRANLRLSERVQREF